jgi:hypothetical protein
VGRRVYCHALECDRRRGIGLSTGFITSIAHSSTIQQSLSGLSLAYNSRLNISQHFRSQHNRCNLGNRRTPKFPSLGTKSLQQLFLLTATELSLTGYYICSAVTQSSEVYDLWSDRREDTFSEKTSISRYLGNLPCCLGSEPQRARHNMFSGRGRSGV